MKFTEGQKFSRFIKKSGNNKKTNGQSNNLNIFKRDIDKNKRIFKYVKVVSLSKFFISFHSALPAKLYTEMDWVTLPNHICTL